MFCPKCGGEVKDGARFCPSCGAEMGRKAPENGKQGRSPVSQIKVPTRKAGTGDRVRKGTGSGAGMPKSSGKTGVLLAGLAAVAVIVLLAVLITKPRMKDTEAQELVAAYFEEHKEYAQNQGQYQECFRYTVDDLTRQLSGKMDSILSGFASGQISMSEAAQGIGEMISSYFSDASNQTTLVEAVTAASSYEVGEIEKQDGTIMVKVTVTSLDITEVNRLLVEDSVSIQGFAKLASQFLFGGGGGIIGNLADMATGDISFVLDEFVSKAKTVERNNTYTGTIEFEYDKETKEWAISHADKGLLTAYYGMR